MGDSIRHLMAVKRKFTQECGRDPTSEEIAEKMELSVAKVKTIVRSSQLPVSLESPVGEDGDSQLGDFIEDRNSITPFDTVSKQLLKEQVDEVLSELTPREKRVLVLRFGLDDERSRTLEEVGLEFKLTRERIRQIEEKAIRRLRHSGRSRKLRSYLDQ
jgi:RNA polymerase primary sigma factor